MEGIFLHCKRRRQTPSLKRPEETPRPLSQIRAADLHDVFHVVPGVGCRHLPRDGLGRLDGLVDDLLGRRSAHHVFRDAPGLPYARPSRRGQVVLAARPWLHPGSVRLHRA